jgi:hypothetical protein
LRKAVEGEMNVIGGNESVAGRKREVVVVGMLRTRGGHVIHFSF